MSDTSVVSTAPESVSGSDTKYISTQFARLNIHIESSSAETRNAPICSSRYFRAEMTGAQVRSSNAGSLLLVMEKLLGKRGRSRQFSY